MRREEKPVRLRTVDDDAPPAAPVVRLRNRETAARGNEEKPVRLGAHPLDPPTTGPGAQAEVSRRLDLPSREELELRTHQPGIEALIENEASNPDALEQNWGDESGARQPIPWGWFVLLGMIIAGALTWSLTRVKEAENQSDLIRIETDTVLVDEQQEEMEATQLIERIENTLKRFFAANSVESQTRMVRHPERVGPLMHAYYAKHPVSPGPLRRIRSLQPLTLDNRADFWMASVELADGSRRELIIEITADQSPLIDWETLVCHQPMAWDEFVHERPAGESMDFRVYVEHDHFFSHEFADANRWACFRLTALDSEETLFGYLAKDSPELPKLAGLLEGGGSTRASVILRLHVPEGLASRRGVVIEQLISPRWIYLDPPDPES
jgi:hypothetical protein